MSELSRRQFVGRSGALLAALAAASAGSSRLLAQALGATAELTPERAETYKALVGAVIEPAHGRRLKDDEIERALEEFTEWFDDQPDDVKGAALLVLDRIETGPSGEKFSKRRRSDNGKFLSEWKGDRTKAERAQDDRLEAAGDKRTNGSKKAFEDHLAEEARAIAKRRRQVVEAYGEHALDTDAVTLVTRWRPEMDDTKPEIQPDEFESEANRHRLTALAAQRLAELAFTSNVEVPGP